MKVTASLKNYGRPARKMRDLVGLVKGLKTDQALSQLMAVSRYGARDLEVLIKSAVANAKNNHNLSEESLRVVDLIIDGGTMLKRWMPRAYGNANRILKRTCQVTVVLEGEELKVSKKGAKKVQKEEAATSKTEETQPTKEANKEESAEDKKTWQENKEDSKEENKLKGGQNWAKKVFRRKSF